MGTIAVLGAGNMGGALVRGFIASGHSAGDIAVSGRDDAALRALADELGVRPADNRTAVEGADIVIVAVKPPDVAAVLREVGPGLGRDTLVVSVAAGVDIATLQGSVPDGTAVFRVMPNTPALVREGMFAVTAGAHVDDEAARRIHALLSGCGRVFAVPEKLQPAATALGGCGPAYVFRVVEAMVDAAVMVGLDRPTATGIAVQTLYGAATLLRESGEHPGRLREQVTSPGGSTARGLRALEASGVAAAFARAIEDSAAAGTAGRCRCSGEGGH